MFDDLIRYWYICFLEHPRSIGEGYFEHMKKAFGIALYLLWFCLLPVLIHAVVTGVFQTTAGDRVYSLAKYIRARRGGIPINDN